MLAALALLLLSQMPEQCYRAPRAGHECNRATGRADSPFAFFEAFPTGAGGAGTFGACSTTAPAGARGEVLTFTRASNATCTKTASGGLATTGIQNGDLVLMPANQPRVEYDSNGVLGLLVESSRTNEDQRSEEINNAWWGDVATGAATPTLNGTCANSPLAAPASLPEDYTFPATTAGQQSGRLGTTIAALASVTGTHSYFVCGVAGAGTMDICAWNTSTPTCAPCAFPACASNTWNRCTYTATSSGNVATFIGNNTLYNGGTARSSNRVCVTAAQAEAGTYATSYIPTTAAAVARVVEVNSMPLPNGLAFGSMALSVTVPWATALTTPRQLALAVVDGTNFWEPFVPAGSNLTNAFTFVASVSDTVNVAGAPLSPLVTARFAQYRSATPTLCGAKDGTSVCDGTGVGSTITTSGGTGLVRFGRDTASTFEIDGIISRICVDPDPTRCR